MLLIRVFFCLSILWLHFVSQPIYASHPPYSKPDSLIIVEGKVLSAATQEPLNAHITYTMLPYGSITGTFFFNHTDGSFTFNLPIGGDYRIEVTSEGYQTASDMIMQTVETVENGKINKLFYLYGSLKKGGFIKLREKIYFDQGNAQLSEESTEALQEIIDLLENNPKMVIQLEGHTESGDRKSLLRLSERRVKAVKDYLVKKGTHHKRIRTKAFGGTRPLTDENTSEARQINRRVEIRIIKM